MGSLGYSAQRGIQRRVERRRSERDVQTQGAHDLILQR